MKRFIFAALVAAGCLWGISVSAQEPQDEYKKELRAIWRPADPWHPLTG